ncbi:MAG: TIGR00159 family protein [Elusimicrobia bacterium]|nr:TIGR00159 family protein [Elusimicrobiota bacterium]MBI4217829.1 TIGR00159 family protein [Elusimicrobiota bacterium]
MAQFFSTVWNYGLKDGLDILLVAAIFYRLMLLVRGTRSVQVLLGILLLAVGTLLADEVLHLTATSWLLEKFWMAGIVILVIVFQPEIRTILAELGSHPLSRWIFPTHFDYVTEVTAALKECSEKRIGALIVFERDTGLKNFRETGVRIQAEVSTELILSVLHPRSPLHDGAIIITGNRIAAAGCLLPLTDDPNIARVLGTRHRAAVGLSESSDAITLVLSEETGQLSIASFGSLERNVDLSGLDSKLRELLRSAPPPSETAAEPPQENVS